MMGKLERDLVRFLKGISSALEEDGLEGGEAREGSLVGTSCN